jgi:hypothetical protein
MADSTPPSTAAVAVAVGLIAITAGYFIGQGSYIGLFGSTGNPSHPSRKSRSWPNSYDVTIHPDSSDEELMAQQRLGSGAQAEESDSDEGHGKELKTFTNMGEEVKLVLAVRTDLGMGKGKTSPATTTRQACLTMLNLCSSEQEKLRHSARTQHSPATNISSTMRRPQLSSSVGKEMVNQRSRCRSNQKMS